MHPKPRAVIATAGSLAMVVGLACTKAAPVESPRASDVCRSEPSPDERRSQAPVEVGEGGVIDLDAVRELPVTRDTAPWRTCELQPTAIPCARHEDCALVRSPCACACARVVGSSRRERRGATRALEHACAEAGEACATCAQPINAVACDAGVCVGVTSVIHVVY